MTKLDLASDNHAPAHPEVMAFLQEINQGHVISYGDDVVTAKADNLMQQHFGPEAQVFYGYTGTACNSLILQAMCQSFEGILCAESAHINEHECGAVEKHSNAKLLTVKTSDGKLTPALLAPLLSEQGNPHCVQVRAISISQLTEWGTCYTISELKALADFAKQHQLYFHMDGARLANACVSLNCSFAAITSEIGIDALSFGGTKNGLLGAEAMVIFNPDIARNMHFIRKQGMQLASKMRFVSGQFIPLLQTSLWKDSAQHANHLAMSLAEKLQQKTDIELLYPVEGNMIFFTATKERMAQLAEHCLFHCFGPEHRNARLVLAFDNTQQEIDALVSAL